MSTGGCCTPGRGDGDREDSATTAPPAQTTVVDRVRTELRGGTFSMGTDDAWSYPSDGEGPAFEATLSPFAIDATAVTVDEFEVFVAATGHQTDAERFGWSFVFGGLLPDDFPETRGVAAAPWWRQVFGADWRHPEGPQSTVAERGAHPVVHVSWFDAMAFASWSGGTLPTEAQWEYAAHGGADHRFPWGDDLEPDGEHRMNVWQGSFPDQNSSDDGYFGTAPVRSFAANDFGLHEMTGNVWEWCADHFSLDRHLQPTTDPAPPASGQDLRVMKGGSYLCHASYCHRYRISARTANSPDTSTGHLGFRTVSA